MSVDYLWRGAFENDEVDALHAEAFETSVGGGDGWDWRTQVVHHSLGWVTARSADRLVGFVNVVWDGFVHAWIQDAMVAMDDRGAGVGTQLIRVAGDGCRRAGCEWLHVDFEGRLGAFYYGACGFTPTSAGLIRLDGAAPPRP
jgi:GNAT superfamily N-acetyltransferase